jgi:hypothetical protein
MKVACVCAHLRSGWIELVSIDAEQTQSILFDLCKPGSVFRVSRFWQNLTQLYPPTPFVLSLNTWPITIEPQSFVARLRLFHMLSICNNEHCTALEFSYGGGNMWWRARTVTGRPTAECQHERFPFPPFYLSNCYCNLNYVLSSWACR